MNRKSDVLNWIRLLMVGIALTQTAFAQRATGIKASNLKGADLGLMNNHDPASQLENFDLLPDYRVNLFAADPMFANPVHMHWDSQGRLWVACSWAYPQLKPGEVANDKIIILEDTDDDGMADKSTVFADGLYLPTGIELANGGCYVAQSPDIFFLKDTDGDDVADLKELVLTGFGIEDSHHSISAWRRGPGGWIYFQEGIFLHSQVETYYGVVRNFNGGVYQFNPRTLELRMFCQGTGGNPWGHVFDRWGQSFMVNNPRIMYLSPTTGNSEEVIRIKPLISTEKQCGGDLATGMHLPKDIRGQLLTCRFKSRTVIRYEFIEDGAGFSANVLPPLIASKHPNFRPVDCKIGPDGAVYVADWYNSIINHAQHDFRDPRRDHEHGRIWRITHKDRPLIKKPKLAGEAINTLLEHLKSPNTWTRHQSRKELSERDSHNVLTATEAWVANLNPNELGYDEHLVEAIWTCQNVESPSEAILKKVLNAKDGHARSAGARIIRYWHDSLSDPVGMIAKLAGDPFPRTRMESVLSAGFIPKAEAFVAVLNVLDHERDKFIDVALAQTVKALEPYWQPKLKSGKLKLKKPEHRAFAERSGGVGFEGRLATFLRKRRPGVDEVADIKAQFIKEANANHVRLAFRSVASKRSRLSPDAKLALLEALAQVGKRGDISLGKKAPVLTPQLASHDDAVTAVIAANIGAWKMTNNGRDLLGVLQDERRSESVRIAAAESLGSLQQTQFLENLREMARSDDMQSRYIATYGLAKEDLLGAASSAAAILTEDPGDADPAQLVARFLQHRSGPGFLLKELKPDQLHPEAVARVAAYHRRTGKLPKQLVRIFVPSTPKSMSEQLRREPREKLTSDVVLLGDPVRGEMIFRRQSSTCAACHGIGTIGPEIGPNLMAVGAAADPAYMVESILEPNKSIAEHYENVMLTLKDGSVKTGVITHKDEKEIVLRDSVVAGSEIRVSLSSVSKQKPMASLMPEGLADQLKSRQEFLDLTNFLSVLGRPGAYANNESPYIRKWRVVAGQSGTLPDEDASWMPAYSMVNGTLPARDLARGDFVYVRGFVNVLEAGVTQLQINSIDGLRLWVDGKSVNDLASPIRLDKGRRTLTLGFDPAQSESGLRVELKAMDGRGKFQPEGGL